MSLPVPAQLYTVATTVLSRLVVLIVPVVVRSDSDRVSESWARSLTALLVCPLVVLVVTSEAPGVPAGPAGPVTG